MCVSVNKLFSGNLPSGVHKTISDPKTWKVAPQCFRLDRLVTHIPFLSSSREGAKPSVASVIYSWYHFRMHVIYSHLSSKCRRHYSTSIESILKIHNDVSNKRWRPGDRPNRFQSALYSALKCNKICVCIFDKVNFKYAFIMKVVRDVFFDSSLLFLVFWIRIFYRFL